MAKKRRRSKAVYNKRDKPAAVKAGGSQPKTVRIKAGGGQKSRRRSKKPAEVKKPAAVIISRRRSTGDGEQKPANRSNFLP